MRDDIDLAAPLLEGDFGLRPPAEATAAWTASRKQALGRLLGLPLEADAELGDFFDLRNER